MMHFTAFTAFFLILTISLALIVPRAQPSNYSNSLEPYDVYHERYIQYNCSSKHGLKFFNRCCHPLPANETAAADLPQCPPFDDEEEDCDLAEPDGTAPATAPATAPVTASVTASVTGNEPQATDFPTTDNRNGSITFYFQNDTLGACGQKYTDQDIIGAMDSIRFGNLNNHSPLCNKTVNITDLDNDKSVVVKIVDDCPSCNNFNSIDLSYAAFSELADPNVGILNNVIWSFVD